MIGCSLWVDGNRLADGSGPDDDAPVALSGLAVSWGRATTVDQVEPSTAKFDLLDPVGGSSFLTLLYSGALVDIRADGTVPAPATLPINEDPSFEAAAVGSAPPWGHYNLTGTAVIVNDRAATGSQSAQLTLPPGPNPRSSAWIPPAPYDDLDPSAWDDLPRMVAGEQWAATAAVQCAVGGTLYLQMYGYPSPRTTSAAPNYPTPFGGRLAATVDPTTSAWRTLKIPPATVPPAVDGMWCGLAVQSDAPRWSTIRPQTADAQPNAVSWADAAGTWEDWGNGYLDDIQVLAPTSAGNVPRLVTVFSGRITDLDAGYDAAAGAVICSVVATDFTADLAQRDAAAPPWPAETLAARFAHIIAAADVDVPYQIAPTLAGWQVSWMDVDRQQCWPLLADLATSVDGVLWSATHTSTGPYLWLADPRTQSALYVLDDANDTGMVTIEPTPAGAAVIELDACDLLLDPVVFRQSVSDVSTRVSLTWLEQTTDDAGAPAPTERTDTFADAALELAIGTRRAAVSTLLTTLADADEVAALILGRLRLTSWRVGGLVWRTDSGGQSGDRAAAALDLLDGTRRLGAALLLENLPGWTPSGGDRLPLLLQGGTYTFEDGQWTLTLVTSSAAAQGSALPWTDLDPAWSWNEFDPAISWSDLVGVAGT